MYVWEVAGLHSLLTIKDKTTRTRNSNCQKLKPKPTLISEEVPLVRNIRCYKNKVIM